MKLILSACGRLSEACWKQSSVAIVCRWYQHVASMWHPIRGNPFYVVVARACSRAQIRGVMHERNLFLIRRVSPISVRFFLAGGAWSLGGDYPISH